MLKFLNFNQQNDGDRSGVMNEWSQIRANVS